MKGKKFWQRKVNQQNQTKKPKHKRKDQWVGNSEGESNQKQKRGNGKKTVKHWRRKLVKVEKKSAQIKLKIAVVS